MNFIIFRLYADGTVVHQDDFSEYDNAVPYYDDFGTYTIPEQIVDYLIEGG